MPSENISIEKIKSPRNFPIESTATPFPRTFDRTHQGSKQFSLEGLRVGRVRGYFNEKGGGEGRVSRSSLPVTPATQNRFKRVREMFYSKFIPNNLACNFKPCSQVYWRTT